MKNIKHRFETYMLYDDKGIEDGLEKMAERGWKLKKIGSFLWTYEKIEPQKLKFQVTYFADASGTDPEPSQEQETLWDFCKSQGWEFVAQKEQMQVFCSEKPNAVDIETDEKIKIENTHKAMKRNLIPSSIILIVLALMQIGMQISRFHSNPLDWIISSGWYVCILWSLVILSSGFTLAEYFSWRHRSIKAVEAGGNCVRANSRYRGVSLTLIILSLAFFVGYMIQNVYNGNSWVVPFGIGLIVLTFGTTFAIRAIMKKNNASAKTNRVVTFIGTFIALMVFIFGGVLMILNGYIAKDADMETYTGTYPNGETYTTEIYHHWLPLTIEDLTETGEEHYSYHATKDGSFLIHSFTGDESALPGSEAPEIYYAILDAGSERLKEFCYKEMISLEDYEKEAGMQCKAVDLTGCEAEKVMIFLNEDGSSADRYVAVEGRRIVRFSYWSWDPDDETITEALNTLLTAEVKP